jgi:hypothetical protein
MKIEFPCPASSNELQPTANGDYCTHCAKEVINIDGMTPQEVKDLADAEGELCISTSNGSLVSYSYSIRKFALSALIVFGSSLFAFADAQVADKINTFKVEKPKEASIALLQVVVVSQDGDTLSGSIQMEIELPNGKTLEPTEAEDGTYWVEIPAYAKGKSVTITADRYGKKKTRTVLISGLGEALVEEIQFKVKRMKYYGRFMGCPSF